MSSKKTSSAIGTNKTYIPLPDTGKQPAPSLRFIDRYKHDGSYAFARLLWTGIIRQDFSTRERSLSTIRKLVERMEDVRRKVYAAPNFEESFRLKRLSEALELVIQTLQRWHFEKYRR